MFNYTGWLLKLWECINPNGLLVISASNKWDSHALNEYIGNWYGYIIQ